jgi:uncharacterized protein (DUF305 family)
VDASPALDDEQLDDGDEVEIRPWWQNPINIVAIVVAVLVLAGSGGYVLGHNRAQPHPNAADVGFLHDMRVHHEQAVQMSFIYLADAGIDPEVATVARSIAMGQSLEIGRMVQLLRDWGEPEVSDSDTVMAWMGTPVDYHQMPGYATTDQLSQLAAASGTAADQLFVQLMVTHHRGGIEMAKDAVTRASVDEVTAMAASMATGQQEEITELQGLVAA